MVNYTAGTVYFQSVSQWFVHIQVALTTEHLYTELLNNKYLYKVQATHISVPATKPQFQKMRNAKSCHVK